MVVIMYSTPTRIDRTKRCVFVVTYEILDVLRKVDVRSGACKRVAWTSTVNRVVVRVCVLRGRNLGTYECVSTSRVWSRVCSAHYSRRLRRACNTPRGVRERLGGVSTETSRSSSADQRRNIILITNSSEYRQYRVGVPRN